MLYRIDCPAKINLHLSVYPPREDGFHPLRSIFAMVSLFDYLQVEIAPPGIFELQDNSPFSMEENILYQCWSLACNRGYFHHGLRVKLQKRIPWGAGLGGGSSDCAGLIKILAKAEPSFPKGQERIDFAAELGSDVPFFLGSPLAFVEGRGEILTPLEEKIPGCFLLYKPDFSIHTGKAFSELDSLRKINYSEPRDLGLTTIQRALRSDPNEWPFWNDFELVLYKDYPLYTEWVDFFTSEGASMVRVSGSGSSLWAHFTSSIDAERAILNFPIKKEWPLKIIPLANAPKPVIL